MKNKKRPGMAHFLLQKYIILSRYYEFESIIDKNNEKDILQTTKSNGGGYLVDV